MRRILSRLLFPALGFAVLVAVVSLIFPMAAGAEVVAGSTIGVSTIAGLAMGAVVELKTLYVSDDKTIYRPGRAVEMPDADAQKLGLSPAKGGGTVSSKSTDESGGGVDADEIPDDFPGAAELRKAGFTMSDVKEATHEDLVAINGIGDKIAEKIISARG